MADNNRGDVLLGKWHSNTYGTIEITEAKDGTLNGNIVPKFPVTGRYNPNDKFLTCGFTMVFSYATICNVAILHEDSLVLDCTFYNMNSKTGQIDVGHYPMYKDPKALESHNKEHPHLMGQGDLMYQAK